MDGQFLSTTFYVILSNTDLLVLLQQRMCLYINYPNPSLQDTCPHLHVYGIPSESWNGHELWDYCWCYLLQTGTHISSHQYRINLWLFMTSCWCHDTISAPFWTDFTLRWPKCSNLMLKLRGLTTCAISELRNGRKAFSIIYREIDLDWQGLNISFSIYIISDYLCHFQ